MADIDLNPDAPWTPERAREISRLFAECARLLNYASHPTRDALDDPADLASVVGDVSAAVTRLIQFFGQVCHIIDLHAVVWEPDGNAGASPVEWTRAWAGDATTDCVSFADGIAGLHQRLSHLRVKENRDG